MFGAIKCDSVHVCKGGGVVYTVSLLGAHTENAGMQQHWASVHVFVPFYEMEHGRHTL